MKKIGLCLLAVFLVIFYLSPSSVRAGSEDIVQILSSDNDVAQVLCDDGDDGDNDDPVDDPPVDDPPTNPPTVNPPVNPPQRTPSHRRPSHRPPPPCYGSCDDIRRIDQDIRDINHDMGGINSRLGQLSERQDWLENELREIETDLRKGLVVVGALAAVPLHYADSKDTSVGMALFSDLEGENGLALKVGAKFQPYNKNFFIELGGGIDHELKKGAVSAGVSLNF